MKLFDIFSKKEIKELVHMEKATKVVETIKNQYPKEVVEIHNTFDRAGEEILIEARSILKECEGASLDKGKRLLSLGFKSSKEAVIVNQILSKESNAREVADLVMKYMTEYPLNKFITEMQVETICKKWNLICGDIDKFKGFVPEKNLKQMENFKGVKSQHQAKFILTRSKSSRFISPEELTKDYHDYISRGNDAYMQNASVLGVDLAKEKYGDFCMVRSTKDLGFQICAPIKDMDTTGTKLDGYKLEKHYPDPIVLQPIIGGYLIVTAWGDEASDEIVQNPIEN